MTIRFAGARKGDHSVPARNACSAVRLNAANDNANGLSGTTEAPAALSPEIVSALRHFARYGLASASKARDEAVAAQARDDNGSFEYWVSMCRSFDVRMARAIAPGTIPAKSS